MAGEYKSLQIVIYSIAVSVGKIEYLNEGIYGRFTFRTHVVCVRYKLFDYIHYHSGLGSVCENRNMFDARRSRSVTLNIL
jgi:hypothetical protein